MHGVLRVLAFVASILALPWAPPALGIEPCKNHYILRPQCEPRELSIRWEAVSTPPFPLRSGHSATLLADGRVLVVGGDRTPYDPVMDPENRLYPGAQLYDPATDTWQVTRPTVEHRYYHEAVRLLDGRVLVIGGDHELLWGEYLASAEIFDPRSGEWTATGDLVVKRGAFSATLLQDGRVLVAGGDGLPAITLRSAEIFDPATGSWSLTGELAGARYNHTATRLADGRVLVVAGLADPFRQLAVGSAEIYDPRLGAWSPAGPVTPRASHTATLLDSGDVLVAGGWSNHPSLEVGSYWWLHAEPTEVFDPSKGEWREAGALATPRSGHSAIPLPGYGVILLGGIARDGTSHRYPQVRGFEIFAEKSWRAVEDADPIPGSVGRFAGATPLADGSALVLGTAGALRLRY